MWSIQEIEDMNPKVHRHLAKIGAIFDPFVCEVAAILENSDTPHVACFFQLPYAVLLEKKWQSASVREVGVRVSFKTQVMEVAIGDSADIATRPLVLDAERATELPLMTQFAVIVPLWGSRLRFYDRYADCVDEDVLHDRLIVRPADNWAFNEKLVAMTASVFEANMARKIYFEMVVMLRRILPAYSALTHLEAPLPPILYNYYLMPFPGRLTLHRPPKPTVSALLKSRTALPKRRLSADHLKRATAGILRDISPFEQQLFAMNRLRQEGEPALALVGCLSLIEWYVDRQVVRPIVMNEEQMSISTVLKDTKYLDFIDLKLRSTLFQAASVRNALVHGSPPPRKSLTDGLAIDAGSEYALFGNSHAAVAERAVDAAFRLYKAINEHKRLARDVST